MEGRILIIEVFYLSGSKGITVYLIEEEMSPSTLGKIIYHVNQPVVSKPNIVQAQVQHALWCITKPLFMCWSMRVVLPVPLLPTIPIRRASQEIVDSKSRIMVISMVARRR
jgi:hypothetical protein